MESSTGEWEKWVPVLELLGEGFSLRLEGRYLGGRDWLYRVTSDQRTLIALMSEEDRIGFDLNTATEPEVAKGIRQAIALLDRRYPAWTDCFPDWIDAEHRTALAKIGCRRCQEPFLKDRWLSFLPEAEQAASKQEATTRGKLALIAAAKAAASGQEE